MLFFLHIPKTAGNTIFSILKNQYQEGFCRPIYHWQAGERNEDLFKWPYEAKEDLRCLAAHIAFGFHEKWPFPVTYLTMLRNPVDRVISDYYFLFQDPGHHIFASQIMATKGLSLEEYVCDERLGLTNVQTRYLGGEVSPEDGTGRPVPCEVFEKARENLLKHIELVGLVERFDESLVLFKKHFGWENPFYIRENVTKVRPKISDIPESTIELIKERNSYDLELYELAKEKYEKLVSREGERFQKEVEEFKKLNNEYQKMEPPAKTAGISVSEKELQEESKKNCGDGMRLIAQGHALEALEILNQVEKGAAAANCYYVRALALADLERVAEAKEEVMQGICADPANGRLCEMLASFHLDVPPTFTFVVSSHMESQAIFSCIKSIYPVASQIILAGVRVPENLPDPSQKIQMIEGNWRSRLETLNAALEYATGDYVWVMDPDRIVTEKEMEEAARLIKDDPNITQVNFGTAPVKFLTEALGIKLNVNFPDESLSAFLLAHYRDRSGIFRFMKGSMFHCKPLRLVWPGAKLATCQIRPKVLDFNAGEKENRCDRARANVG